MSSMIPRPDPTPAPAAQPPALLPRLIPQLKVHAANLTGSVRSMRWRLQAWYAAVLLVVVVGFAALLYGEARQAAFRRVDEQLIGAAQYLDATLRHLPPDNGPDDDGPPDEHDPPPPRRRPPPEGRRGFPPPRRPPPPPHGAHPPFRGEPPPHLRGEPPQHGSPPPHRMRDRIMAELEIPDSLLREPPDHPEDAAYFVIWNADGSVLKSSLTDPPKMPTGGASMAPPDIAQPRQNHERREILQRGPRSALILVGKPMRPELAVLAGFGGRLFGTGCLVLIIGLAGGWVISKGIVRPIARMATTADAISATNLGQRIDTEHLDSELVGLGQVLNEMFGRLEASFERQTRFTADASHELRTPLALLHSQVELALKRPRSGDEYREALQTCLQASDRMRSLIDGLLTLARADAGRLAIAADPVDFAGVVDETCASYQSEAERHHISLSATLPSGPVMVRGDATVLARVLANLLSNALRHTPAGGSIEVGLSADDHFAELSVADTGCGIPAADQPRVFERFFRVDRARSRALGGNGLGLAICKSVVEAHGGTIAFNSRSERGTTFTVRLPVLPAHVEYGVVT
jgi:heavy metal sensor kinase